VALSQGANDISVAFKDGSRQGPFDQVVSFDCDNVISQSFTRVPLSSMDRWSIARHQQAGPLRRGVNFVASGHIPVDDFENANVPGVCDTNALFSLPRTRLACACRNAIGDAAEEGWELTLVAIACRRLADRLFGGVVREIWGHNAGYAPSVSFRALPTPLLQPLPNSHLTK
jgi:hypothetical protein